MKTASVPVTSETRCCFCYVFELDQYNAKNIFSKSFCPKNFTIDLTQDGLPSLLN